MDGWHLETLETSTYLFQNARQNGVQTEIVGRYKMSTDYQPLLQRPMHDSTRSHLQQQYDELEYRDA